MWLLITVFALVVALKPRLSGDSHSLHPRLWISLTVPALAYLIVTLAQKSSWSGVALYAAHTTLATVCGYLLLLITDHRGPTRISRRWRIMLAPAFSGTVSVLYTFWIYYGMYLDGVVLGIRVLEMIHALMAPMLVWFPVSILVAILLRRGLRSVEDELTPLTGGA